ncbi:hypothetical protein AU476_21565 [Cupriavidus sp. UYMSc13B]|nr:hypothetical protein AU476_00135 [Cupriavidus sp. UYMSc13B]RWA51574.1 hypothetical protein AU476_21565 [Cupriavidus sp. UYMSc13B]
MSTTVTILAEWYEALQASLAALRVVTVERDLLKEQLKAFQRKLFAAKSEARGSEQKDLFLNEAEATGAERCNDAGAGRGRYARDRGGGPRAKEARAQAA